MQLHGKVAVVTGGGSGIGKASALLLAREGARVAVLDMDRDEVEETAGEIAHHNGTATTLVANISHPDEMQQAYQRLLARWGRLDIVFANAGINGVWAPIEELTPEEWDVTLDTNLKGTFLTVKYAIPAMKEHGGSIIVTSSINGTRVFSNAGASAYSSSKAGQVAFAKMAALELARYGIRVNVICPGAIETHISENTVQRHLEEIHVPAFYPSGTMPLTHGEPGSPEQVAQLVLFLASDASNLITGTEVWIDGAESLLQG